MKKIFLLFSLVIIFVSCKTSLSTNKLQGYDKQIENKLSIYIAVIADSDQKTKFATGLKEKLIKEFESKGIAADVKIIESDASNKSHDFNKEDISTTNANGLTLLIVESSNIYIHKQGEGNFEQKEFTIRLTDHHQQKDVWVTETQVPFGMVMGGTNALSGGVCKQIINSLKKDGLLKK